MFSFLSSFCLGDVRQIFGGLYFPGSFVALLFVLYNHPQSPTLVIKILVSGTYISLWAPGTYGD